MIAPESLSEEARAELAKTKTPREFIRVLKRAKAGLVGAGKSLESVLTKILISPAGQGDTEPLSLGSFAILSEAANKEEPVKNKKSKVKKKKA